MKRFCLVLAALMLLISSVVAAASVIVVPVSGGIGPARADFVVRALERARQEGAGLVVLEMDTPGGLDTAMRQIIKAIVASPVPVVTYVAPGGARAASAGTYILYASHVAAMAPGTNLGAATPVEVGVGAPGGDASAAAQQSKMERKQVNDAAAYLRGLAQMRGRNVDWAERAVREAVSLPADEALREHVVDLVARDLPDLLARLDGRSVKTAAGVRVLHTAGAALVRLEPDWRERFLAVISEPSIALLLMMLGLYGLFFEFMNPGMVLPGVVGGICLLLGLFALQLLPVNYAGLGLILLGLASLVAEMFLPSFGALGLGGIVAFTLGALMLIDTEVPGFGIPLPLILALAASSAIVVFLVGGVALKARRRPVVCGDEELLGCDGVLLGALEPADGGAEGWARVHGEQWRVRADRVLPAGATVTVTGRNGLVLSVTQSEGDEHGAV